MEGDADGSMAMTEAAEKFRAEHDQLHEELTTPERTKSVCEVCGVFINSTDNEQRRLVRPSTVPSMMPSLMLCPASFP
jgi:RNA-binding protein Luc7-like 2